MSNVLEKICDKKKVFIKESQIEYPESFLEEQIKFQKRPLNFAKTLEASLISGSYSLIAEIKKASPSRGLIRENFEPSKLALAYKLGGATCLSVLTDTPYFQGCINDLKEVRCAVDLPILRKDFIIDPYQILETRAIGADCVLLIMAVLTDQNAALLYKKSKELDMDVLIEVHDENEMDRALSLEPELIGINNRNLKTLNVDLRTSERLAHKVPKGIILVSESGIFENTDLKRISAVGINCFLVGEALMRQENIEQAVKNLLDDKIINRRI